MRRKWMSERPLMRVLDTMETHAPQLNKFLRKPNLNFRMKTKNAIYRFVLKIA